MSAVPFRAGGDSLMRKKFWKVDEDMKIAVTGKGGVGKTTFAATLAR